MGSGVSWGRGGGASHGDYGQGGYYGLGPSSPQWRLFEARQVAPSSFWEVMG